MPKIFKRRRGDVLQPGRFPSGVVAALRTKKDFDPQYQQEPHPATGRIFNPNWWRYYKRNEAPAFELVVVSVDCAFKSKKENDLVAIQKWGVIGVKSYLAGRDSRHMGYVQTKQAIRQMVAEEPRGTVVLIEDKANGSATIEELKADDSFGSAVIAIDPQGDKVSRANAASADVEAGSVYLPDDLDGSLVRTFAAFPSGRYDDDVDAASQFLNWRRTRNLAYGVLDHAKRVLREIAEGIRDAFGELIRKPAPNPVAVQARTQKETRVDNFAASKKANDPCTNPDCRSTSTIPMSDGHGGWVLHCNQCGANDGVLPPKPIVGNICPVAGCGITLQVLPDRSLRCQNHGQFTQRRPEDPVPPQGVSRRDRLARLGSYALRTPRWRF